MMRTDERDTRRMGRLALSAWLVCTTSGVASAGPRTCGTIVVPAGVGMSDPASVNSMHPALWGGALYESQTMDLMFRPLVYPTSKLAIDWNGSLAAAIDVSADNTVFVVTLKDWDWSDGTPVTSADVMFDWKLIRELGAAFEGYGTGGIPDLVGKVEALDAHRIRFTTTRPVTPDWFELVGLGSIYALPSADWGRHSLSEQQSLQSQGSFYRLSDGPFLLQEFHVGRYAAFVPNPRYGGHRPTMRRLVVDFLQGADPLEALKSGEVDIANLPFQVWNATTGLEGFEHVPVGPSAELYTIIPNIRSPSAPFLAEVAVRQAISMAIDQKRIIDVVYHGNAMLDRAFVPTALTDDLAPGLREGHSSLDYDPARAGAMLDAAGWRTGPDGIRARDGRRAAFTVFVTAGIEERLLTLQLIQSDLRAVGIGLDIKEMEFNQLIAKMLGPPDGWQGVYMGWSMPSYPDGTQWFSSTSSSDYSHYADPHMDSLLRAATREPGRDALYALEQYALEQQPMIFLPSGFYTVLARRGIGGINRFIGTNGNWSPEYLTLPRDMQCDDGDTRPPA